VFGHRKSVAGTLTFFATSLVVLVGFAMWGDGGVGFLSLVGIAALASAVENVAVQGLDNLLVPVVVGLLLTRLL
jgi:dolichol kinase